MIKTPRNCRLFHPMILLLALATSSWLADVNGAHSIRAAEPEVSYHLDFSQAANHYVIVTAEFETTGLESLEVFMPVWTPGSYLIREYARNIETMTAADENGNFLPVRKTRKNRWQVETRREVDRTRIKYRLYCRELSVRTNWVEEGFAILNGAPTFVTRKELLKSPHRVTIDKPESWSRISTALLPVPETDNQFLAPDFDYLVDSPILVGNQQIESFEVGGADHQLVSLGGDGLWDFQKAANDLAKVVQAHHDLWQEIPYDNYKFLNLIVEAGGGLEHDNSTLMMTSRWNFGTRSRYLSWLSLASHEFFHTWNIRRLRPVELVEYDYENENYFSTLWIGEGVTSYYDDLLVKRAGLSSESEYLGQLSRQIRSLQTTAGRLTQSLADSSQDTWIKFYRPDENSRNARISYYTKGAVAAFLLDAEIREATGGEKSLDDVMRQLYQKYSGNRGFTSPQFRELASEVAGKDLSDWFALAIDSTQELDYGTALQHFGLQFKNSGKSDKDQPVWTGLSLSSEDGVITVSGVIRNSPAFEAGINVGDEIVALDGYRVTSSNLDSRTKPFKDGDVKSILITRRGRVLEKQIEFKVEPTESWTLSKVAKPTEEQQQRLDNWLRNERKKEQEKEKNEKDEAKASDADDQVAAAATVTAGN